MVYSEQYIPHSALKRSQWSPHGQFWCSCSPQIQLVPVHFLKALLPLNDYLRSRPLSKAFPLQSCFLPNPGSSTEQRKSTVLTTVYLGGNGIFSPVSTWEETCSMPKKFPSSFDDPSSRLCVLQLPLSEKKPKHFILIKYLPPFQSASLASYRSFCFWQLSQNSGLKAERNHTDSVVSRRDQGSLLHISCSCAFLAFSLTSPVKSQSFLLH